MKRLLILALFSYSFLHGERTTLINNSCYNVIVNFSSYNGETDNIDLMWVSVFVPRESTITIDPFDPKDSDPIIEKTLYTEDKLLSYRDHFQERLLPLLDDLLNINIRPTQTILFDKQCNSFFYNKVPDYNCSSLVVRAENTPSIIKINHKVDHFLFLELKANPLNATIS